MTESQIVPENALPKNNENVQMVNMVTTKFMGDKPLKDTEQTKDDLQKINELLLAKQYAQSLLDSITAQQNHLPDAPTILAFQEMIIERGIKAFDTEIKEAFDQLAKEDQTQALALILAQE